MTYKLTYFDERNRAEPLRLIFEYAGQKFEDIRLNDQEFLKQRNSFPNGQLPVLEFDNDKVLGQSGSIIRFLARKFNLVGSNETEAARADEVFETYKDRLNEQIPYIMFKVGDPNFKDGEKYYKDGYLPASKRALKYYDEVIGDKQFVLNSGPSYADFAVAEHLETIFALAAELKEQHPKLQAYRDRVYSLKPIADYIRTRKYSIL